MLRRLIREDIDLCLVLDPALGSARLDPSQVEQVIVNLVVNARDALPEGGKLTIETANVDLDAAYAASHAGVSAGPHVLLAVSDTGSGMPPEVLAHAFEPFFTTKPVGQGTGLGLATVYGIVKQSGGHVWAYSELGHGTTIKAYFPRVEAPRVPEERRALAPRAGGDETLLVVEDEEVVRRLACRVLRKAGYTVLEAAAGPEALRLCDEHPGPIALMLADVVMPGMTGRALAERAAGRRPEMRVLFTSGYTENAIVHHGVLDAGVDFIGKPFAPQALLRKVRDLLDRPRGASGA
jgi:CheY-like chemotaxis protein